MSSSVTPVPMFPFAIADTRPLSLADAEVDVSRYEAFTVFLAGGGVKPGISWGATDEIGHVAVDGKVHMHDLHATVLHQLGIDHEQLTYKYAGREFRLTDLYGRVVSEILL